MANIWQVGHGMVRSSFGQLSHELYMLNTTGGAQAKLDILFLTHLIL